MEVDERGHLTNRTHPFSMNVYMNGSGPNTEGAGISPGFSVEAIPAAIPSPGTVAEAPVGDSEGPQVDASDLRASLARLASGIGPATREVAGEIGDAAKEKAGEVTGRVIGEALKLGLRALVGSDGMKRMDNTFKDVLGAAVGGLGHGIDTTTHSERTAAQAAPIPEPVLSPPANKMT